MNESLFKKIDIFIDKKDQSLKIASEIESELLKLFPEDEYVEEVSDAIAQYRPGGGDFLFHESDIEKKLGFLKKYLIEKE